MSMELELIYNEETQEWEEKPEPFITIECETEEDFEFIGTAVAFYKKHLEGQEKPQTNADRIRAMSDEELAEFICGIFDDDEYFGKFINGRIIPCYDQHKIAEWLKQPAPEPPKEESQPDCAYNKNGHCMGQKLMPECDPKNCDRRKSDEM